MSLSNPPLELQSGPPATGLRKPESPKSAGESAAKSAGKRGTAGSSAGRPLSSENQRNGTAPSSPPSSPLFPGTLRSTLPGTCFRGLGLSQSCSRRPRLQLLSASSEEMSLRLQLSGARGPPQLILEKKLRECRGK